ncbi:MAG: YvrJ family protein [Bacteroidales bacterium]|jgi:hypothetical protein
MDFQEILLAVGNYGFPIVVSGYLLLRMEKTVNTLSGDVRDLKETIKDLPDRLK